MCEPAYANARFVGAAFYCRSGMRVGEIPVAMIHSSLVGSRNFERGEAAAREVGPDAHALPLDVTDQASITAAAKRVRNEFGRLDAHPKRSDLEYE
jgi:enoyl-[acyl-carrier-protein] reductase (NADH)